MTLLEEIVQANKEYLRGEHNLPSLPGKPSRKIIILTCIDCRLPELLEPAMGIKRGEANIIKTAGNYVSSELNDTIRSLMIGVYELGATEIFVVGHHNCGVAASTSTSVLEKMKNAGIAPETIAEMKKELPEWLDTYTSPVTNVEKSVENIKNSPFIPNNIPVHGLVIDPDTGKLDLLVTGY